MTIQTMEPIPPVVVTIASETSVSEGKKEPFLLDRIGGPAALNAAVDIFYERIVSDVQLTNFFEGISMNRLKIHQTKFLTLAFTEIPADLDVAAYLIDKHSRLFQEKGLDGTHFDLVAGHLVATLQQLNVPENLIGEVVAIVGPLRAVFADEADRIKNECKG